MTPDRSPMSGADATRLKQTLGAAELRRLIDALRRRFARGLRRATGTVTLRAPTAAEREAVDALLGRRPSSGDPLVVSLAGIEQVIQHAGLAPTLVDAVETLLGPIEDQTAARQADERQWRAVFDGAIADFDQQPELLDWLKTLRRTGQLKRIARGDAGRAAVLLEQATATLRRLPHRGVTLGQLATEITGDAHALDRGQPLMTVLAGAVATLAGVEDVRSSARFRRAWDRLGVTCDELSATVLLLNLRADIDTLTGVTLALHAEAGEPLRLTARSLLRTPPSWRGTPPPQAVHICENPTIVTVAADRLAAGTRPLLCTEGQPSTAVSLLLNALVEHGVPLLYHGDFDWPGLRIANHMHRRWPMRPWRMNADDYRDAAASASHPLVGRRASASWDRRLGEAMAEAGVAVFEEQVAQRLMTDLRQ